MREMKITRDQLYNADETGLFWQLLPDKTFVHVDERDAPGLKISKQRVTVLACTNATGSHKLTPLVIGKSKNPRCFKGWNNPLLYNNSQSAWMTSFIFKEWFFKNFVPEVSFISSFIHFSERLNLFRNAQVKHFCRNNNLPESALLIIDNARCHPPKNALMSEDRKICVLFLPPNVTSILQPMDQNVLRLLKLFYRKRLLSEIVSNKTLNVANALKSVDLEQAITLLNESWIHVKLHRNN